MTEITSTHLRFRVHNYHTGQQVGEIFPSSADCNDPVEGAGELNLTVPVPEDVGDKEMLKQITRPKRYAVYVTWGSSVLWGGFFDRRVLTSSSSLTIHASQWESWFYGQRFWTPKKFVQQSENAIMLALFNDVTTRLGDLACAPLMRWGGGGSGFGNDLRDLVCEFQQPYGEAMDRLSGRDHGFEWSMRPIVEDAYHIVPWLYMWQQGRQRVSLDVLYVDDTSSYANIAVGEIPEDATQRVSRVWTSGAGQWPDIPYVSDDDPDLTISEDSDSTPQIYTETYTNYSSVKYKATLKDHARRERLVRAAPAQEVSVDMSVEDPAIDSYGSGDRIRLVIDDGWNDIDLPAVRITDKAIRFSENAVESVTCVLDLNDYEMPDESEEA